MSTFGLIGKSLSHSFSKDFFQKKFQSEGLLHTYENFEFQDLNLFASFLKGDFAGLNITIPYKEAVIPFLDELSEEAKKIGAVNTIVFKNGITIGHNTDAFGFQQSIKPFLTFEHERALILGTGGASKAVAHVFREIGLEVFFITRNPSEPNHYGYDDINEHMLNACKCIVNTTPVGMFPKKDEVIPFPYTFLSDKHFVIDLIYNPTETLFLKKSKEAGATTLNGQSMLQHQALKAWELWNS